MEVWWKYVLIFITIDMHSKQKTILDENPILKLGWEGLNLYLLFFRGSSKICFNQGSNNIVLAK